MSQAEALNPVSNTVIEAAAGTGKTWLLTSRIIRLLLAGSAPGSILAISFTRKAAGQIHERVVQRLMEMAGAGESRLIELLQQIDAPTDSATRAAARGLYERLLSSVHELRASTFHAFCQDILQRFALEAAVPPRFDVYESTGELETVAWRALDRELIRNPQSPTAACMNLLLDRSGGPEAARQVLRAFLEHRGDWWAYVENQADPVGYALEQLQSVLQVAPIDKPVNSFIEDESVADNLARYAQLLGAHATKTHLDQQRAIERALGQRATPEKAFDAICRVLLTKDGGIRMLRSGKAQEAALGANRFAQLRQLQAQLAQRLQMAIDHDKRLKAFEISRAWYVCGQRLVHHYQRLKREHGLLDFADLEWNTYRLLNRGRHAQWVQYKLDQRIDHLLVDEFQDTNPTQWRLLLPLLREMSAGDPERRRSVFLVGDEKQSIYRFRRADPLLFRVARDWLSANMGARVLGQEVSRRSSPAILRFVNLLFEPEYQPERFGTDTSRDFSLPDFRRHASAHPDRWGLVEVLPLIAAKTPVTEPTPAPTAVADTRQMASVRNPLEQPRIVADDLRHHEEGALVAAKVRDLVGRVAIDRDDGARTPLCYGDCLILLRDRTHASAYEEALRNAGIPYVGTGRGAFPDHLEVRDLVYLLKVLISPRDNLALASVLRSPIFDAGDDELMMLAQSSVSPWWYDRLQQLDDIRAPPNTALARAKELLPRWAGLADRIPVHDLLDRIYNEGNVIERYLSAAPPYLQVRVEMNLNQFLALALDIDSGRYPGIARFLVQLQALTAGESESAYANDGTMNCVRLLTIHAAKGMEAPVVFLVDAARNSVHHDHGPRVLVDWPVDAARPRHFNLIGRKDELDSVTLELIARQQLAVQREESNLLYVALTRARQVLCISGCEPGRKDRGWYGFIETRLDQIHRRANPDAAGLDLAHPDAAHGPGIHARLEHGSPPRPHSPSNVNSATPISIDPSLTRPVADVPKYAVINPSKFAETEREAHNPSAPMPASPTTAHQDLDNTARLGARNRGDVIHRMLEKLTGGGARATHKSGLRAVFGIALSEDAFESCWREACGVVDHTALADLFDPKGYESARNEVPVLYRNGGQDVFGTIDRLVIKKSEVIVMEYKTHAHATPANAATLARNVEPQIRLYAEAVRTLWPTRRLRAVVLFTRCAARIDVELDP